MKGPPQSGGAGLVDEQEASSFRTQRPAQIPSTPVFPSDDERPVRADRGSWQTLGRTSPSPSGEV